MFFRPRTYHLDKFGKTDITLMQKTEHNKIPYVEMNVFNFLFQIMSIKIGLILHMEYCVILYLKIY